jgi:hypothetical protein
MHDAGHALNAFKTATRSRGGSLFSVVGPFYAQAQLGLARAYAMGGDKADAKKAYDAFFLTWKDADAESAHAGGSQEGIRLALTLT